MAGLADALLFCRSFNCLHYAASLFLSNLALYNERTPLNIMWQIMQLSSSHGGKHLWEFEKKKKKDSKKRERARESVNYPPPSQISNLHVDCIHMAQKEIKVMVAIEFPPLLFATASPFG
jgi:hypothetical protein